MGGEAERFDEYSDGPWPWRSMSEAPKDGTQILVCRDTGCGWEFEVVWRSEQTDDYPCDYPWQASGTAYVEDRFDYWQPLQPPAV